MNCLKIDFACTHPCVYKGYRGGSLTLGVRETTALKSIWLGSTLVFKNQYFFEKAEAAFGRLVPDVDDACVVAEPFFGSSLSSSLLTLLSFLRVPVSLPVFLLTLEEFPESTFRLLDRLYPPMPEA